VAVSDPGGRDIERADVALRSGDWQAARDAYLAAEGSAPTGEVAFGLGVASWWLGETEAALRSWERAYAAFRRQAEQAQAVVAAFYLCLANRMSLGNEAAANGWLERAASLVDEFDLAPIAGWVHLARAYTANDSDDPAGAAELARLAISTARDTDDTDLVLCATAELGAALLAAGQAEEGAALLDQAMAAALAGEGTDLDTVVLVSCRTITACSRCVDITRAMQWIRAADDFHRRFGSTHLYTTCRTHHGEVLFAAGDWQRADEELQRALRAGGTGDAALRSHAAAKLAELRIAQGRL
jgi:tetratricopeptide (TPR) repeat protein